MICLLLSTLEPQERTSSLLSRDQFSRCVTLLGKVSPARNWAKVRAFDSPFKCTLLSSVFERMCFLPFLSFVSELRTVLVVYLLSINGMQPSRLPIRLLQVFVFYLQ